MLPGMGMAREMSRTAAMAVWIMGRVPAMTMMANTNIGSVKLRESTYAVAAAEPSVNTMAITRIMAQKPKTTSTSLSRCHTPEWRGLRSSSLAKALAENVWRMATPNRMAAMTSMVDGFMLWIFRLFATL